MKKVSSAEKLRPGILLGGIIKKRGPLLDHLDQIESLTKTKNPTLCELFNIFGSDGHFVLILFLILPFTQPIPIPGLSTPFGILIAGAAALFFLRKPPWLPRSWQSKVISAEVVLRIAEGSERIFEKISFLLYPRLRFLFFGPFRSLNVFLLILNALLLALPLPIPFSNAFPAWVIFLQALGFLYKDGVFIILSYLQTAACLVYFWVLLKGIQMGVSFFH